MNVSASAAARTAIISPGAPTQYTMNTNVKGVQTGVSVLGYCHDDWRYSGTV